MKLCTNFAARLCMPHGCPSMWSHWFWHVLQWNKLPSKPAYDSCGCINYELVSWPPRRVYSNFWAMVPISLSLACDPSCILPPFLFPRKQSHFSVLFCHVSHVSDVYKRYQCTKFCTNPEAWMVWICMTMVFDRGLWKIATACSGLCWAL
jgi:hypothetical protein